ncbi:VIT family protein [Microbacterium lushaniae]|uniref:VIT family protein n=2 Tax=Microbacterium lushaniae TaxID=2614639 RepID=A0A5J6L847_9MICO|nr:VIT family protein [Microbacterium lushaniae]
MEPWTGDSGEKSAQQVSGVRGDLRPARPRALRRRRRSRPRGARADRARGRRRAPDRAGATVSTPGRPRRRHSGTGPSAAHTGGGDLAARMNSLRAGVLGANDGIVSVAAVVVGVAGASAQISHIVTAGAAALIGGAISMAVGEYVSVSSQRDTERALIAHQRQALSTSPEAQLARLKEAYRAKGLSDATAQQVAGELTAQDPLAAHLEAEYAISAEQVVSPWTAALSSGTAFVIGAVLPMAAILLPPPEWRVTVTFITVLLALAVTGAGAARIGGAPPLRAMARTVLGGALALTATWAAGTLLDSTGVV